MRSFEHILECLAPLSLSHNKYRTVYHKDIWFCSNNDRICGFLCHINVPKIDCLDVLECVCPMMFLKNCIQSPCTIGWRRVPTPLQWGGLRGERGVVDTPSSCLRPLIRAEFHYPPLPPSTPPRDHYCYITHSPGLHFSLSVAFLLQHDSPKQFRVLHRASRCPRDRPVPVAPELPLGRIVGGLYVTACDGDSPKTRFW